MKTATLPPRQGAPRKNKKNNAVPVRQGRNRSNPATESKLVTCAQAAEILRIADQMLTPKDRTQIAAGIEEARRHMNNEHLH